MTKLDESFAKLYCKYKHDARNRSNTCIGSKANIF